MRLFRGNHRRRCLEQRKKDESSNVVHVKRGYTCPLLLPTKWKKAVPTLRSSMVRDSRCYDPISRIGMGIQNEKRCPWRAPVPVCIVARRAASSAPSGISQDGGIASNAGCRLNAECVDDFVLSCTYAVLFFTPLFIASVLKYVSFEGWLFMRNLPA